MEVVNLDPANLGLSCPHGRRVSSIAGRSPTAGKRRD
jgi:hypothetical protein